MAERSVTDLLHFARTQLRDQLDLDNCPHNARLDPSDTRCIDCEAALPCRWLEHCEDVTARRDMALAVLCRTLEQGMGYVQDLVRDWGHNSLTCLCETCQWLRKARRTCRESRGSVQGSIMAGPLVPWNAANNPVFGPKSQR